MNTYTDPPLPGLIYKNEVAFKLALYLITQKLLERFEFEIPTLYGSHYTFMKVQFHISWVTVGIVKRGEF